MTQALATQNGAKVLEQVLIGGDLSKLTGPERVLYYRSVCESLRLNPLTKPFSYIVLNNKLTLYANRDCTDQLRAREGVSVNITAREIVEGVYVVTAQATLPDGRTDESIGAVPIEALKGETRANAMMKAETKAKRRVTLSIIGLGWLDETELDSIADAVLVDPETGEVPSHPDRQGPTTPLSADKPNYTAFWGQARHIVGATRTNETVHTMLQVEKMEQWQALGYTLDDALVVLKALQEGEAWEEALRKVSKDKATT